MVCIIVPYVNDDDVIGTVMIFCELVFSPLYFFLIEVVKLVDLLTALNNKNSFKSFRNYSPKID